MQAQCSIGMACQRNHHRLILGKGYQLDSGIHSEISLLIAILSIAVSLQQYRAILSIALHCVTEVVYCG